jgi:hypothetical protein
MAYIINRFDGTQLTIVDDGVLDISTPLGLIGRNYTGYGETQNENFVFLLENFANTSPPARALTGQIWYNTTANALQVYSSGPDNTKVWLSIGNATVSETEPAHSTGGLWMNSVTNQLYVSNGTVWNQVGPEGVQGFATTKLTSTKIRDSVGTFKPVILAQINGNTTAILSTESFTINAQDEIVGFSELSSGINLRSGSVLNGNVKGNATTATRLETARTINNVQFNGTSDITVLSNTNAPLIAGDYIIGSEFNGAFRTTWDIDATPENLIGKIVARDSTGEFTATRVNASEFVGELIGNVTTLTGNSTFNNITVTDITGNNFSGLAARATKLQSPRLINTVPFDGTADISLPVPAETLTGSTLAPNIVSSSLSSLGQLEFLSVEAPGITVGDGNNMNIKIEGFTPTIESDTTNVLKLKLATGAVTATASTTVTFLSASAASADGVVSPALVPDYTLGTNIDQSPVLGLPSYRWRNIYSKAATLDTLNVTTLSGRTLADQVTVSKDLVINGTMYGNVAGTVTGSLIGAASLNLLKSGDVMSGDLAWTSSGRGLVWSMNTDFASIKYYNSGDGDTNTRLEFNTGDNTNEYFRWTHTSGASTYESMRLTPNSNGGAVLTVTGQLTVVGGGVSASTYIGDGGQLTNLNATQLLFGTVPVARLAGTYNINIAGNVSGNVSGNLTGNVTGNLAGTVTGSLVGAASLNVLKTGDNLSGDLSWNTSGRGLSWGMNSDGASIRFYNVSDGDAASRLEFQTTDNGNEYFSWTHALSGGGTIESMRLVPNSSNAAILSVFGSVSANSFAGTFNGVGTNLTINADNITIGTVPRARLSGTYDVNITGNANYATSAGSAAANIQRSGDTMLGRLGQHVTGFHASGIGAINTRTNSGFYDNPAPTTASGWPVTGSWYHLLSSTHTNDANYYAMQLSADFYGQNLYYRSTAGNGDTAWSKILHSGNYNDYAPTKTGVGASGTWQINVTGNASSVTAITSNQVTSALGYIPVNTANLNNQAGGNISGVNGYFSGALYPSTAGIIFPVDPFGGSGDAVSIGVESLGGERMRLRFRVTNDGGVSPVDDKAEFLVPDNDSLLINGNVVLNAANFNNYAPTRAGVGATGTWAINITGNAASASTVSWNGVSNKPNNIVFNDGNTYGINISGTAAVASTAPRIYNLGNVAAESNGTSEPASALTLRSVYTNGYPTSYGNAITLGGAGGGELLVGWSGTTGGHADNYVRSRRDTGNIWSPWAKILTDANIYSYTPSTTGAGASGLWPISITGNAVTVSSITSAQVITALGYIPVNPSTVTNSAGSAGNFSTVNASGNIQINKSNPTLFLNHTAGGFDSGIELAISVQGEDFIIYEPDDGDREWFRINDTGSVGSASVYGQTILDARNYTNYAPTKTGTGASGNWPINITGSAATVTTISSGQITNALGYIPVNPSTLTNQSGTAGSFSTIAAGGDITITKSQPTIFFNDTSDSGIELAIRVNSAEGLIIYEPEDANSEWFRIDDNSNTGYLWQSQILTAANYTSFAPAKTGTGASGTWPISINGNAATVTTVTSAQITTGLGYTPINKAGDLVNGELNLQDNNLRRANLIDCSIAHIALGNVSGGTTVNMELGNYASAVAVGSVTWTFANPPTGARAGSIILELTNGGAFTQFWPAAVRWPAGAAPSLSATGVDVLVFITDDAGANWRGAISMGDSR